MSRHKFVYMVVVDAKIRNAFFSCSATYLTKFFTDSFNFSSVPDKLRPNKNDTSPSCLDPSSVDQDIPKVNSHHPIFYGAPVEPKVHFFVFISPISRLRGHHVLNGLSETVKPPLLEKEEDDHFFSPQLLSFQLFIVKGITTFDSILKGIVVINSLLTRKQQFIHNGLLRADCQHKKPRNSHFFLLTY